MNVIEAVFGIGNKFNQIFAALADLKKQLTRVETDLLGCKSQLAEIKSELDEIKAAVIGGSQIASFGFVESRPRKK